MKHGKVTTNSYFLRAQISSTSPLPIYEWLTSTTNPMSSHTKSTEVITTTTLVPTFSTTSFSLPITSTQFTSQPPTQLTTKPHTSLIASPTSTSDPPLRTTTPRSHSSVKTFTPFRPDAQTSSSMRTKSLMTNSPAIMFTKFTSQPETALPTTELPFDLTSNSPTRTSTQFKARLQPTSSSTELPFPTQFTARPEATSSSSSTELPFDVTTKKHDMKLPRPQVIILF